LTHFFRHVSASEGELTWLAQGFMQRAGADYEFTGSGRNVSCPKILEDTRALLGYGLLYKADGKYRITTDALTLITDDTDP